MPLFDKTLAEFDTPFDHYQVVETVYAGRPSRVLFSGDRAAAQSGLALDDKPELLFDYNQRLLEAALHFRPASLLLIGGGSYTLPRTLQRALPDCHITIIEQDPELLLIAQKYFDFTPGSNTTVVAAEGRKYINETNRRFSFIMIDAFSNLAIPRQLATIEAIKRFGSCLAPGGLLAMNLIASYKGQSSIVVERLDAAYGVVFKKHGFFPADVGYSQWQAQNLILLAHAGSQNLQDFMRYTKMPELNTSVTMAMQDLAKGVEEQHDQP